VSAKCPEGRSGDVVVLPILLHKRSSPRRLARSGPDTRTHPHFPACDASKRSEGRSKEDGQEDSIATDSGSVVNTAVVTAQNEADTLDNASTTTVEVVEPSGGGGPDGCTITGTSGRDVLRGTKSRDVICGLGGDDRLLGKGGSDTLKAGPGRDMLRGGRGNDRLIGQAGKDRFSGGAGRDHCESRGRARARGCE